MVSVLVFDEKVYLMLYKKESSRGKVPVSIKNIFWIHL